MLVGAQLARPLFTIVLSALLLTACGTSSPSGAPPAAPSFEDAPVAVRERLALPFCGEETARLNDGFNIEGRRCLWAAYQQRQPAEFITTRWSIEGDPLTWIYRVLPNGAVEVFIDSTQDRWSARTWLHLACPGLSLIEGDPAQPAFGPGLKAQAGGDCRERTLR